MSKGDTINCNSFFWFPKSTKKVINVSISRLLSHVFTRYIVSLSKHTKIRYCAANGENTYLRTFANESGAPEFFKPDIVCVGMYLSVAIN